MPNFTVYVDTIGTYRIEVEASSAEAAMEYAFTNYADGALIDESVEQVNVLDGYEYQGFDKEGV